MLGYVPYLIKPKDAVEATYGKATLLTDTMIAQLLDGLRYAKAQTDDGQELLVDLWRKLYDLWDEPCPSQHRDNGP